MWDLRRYRIKLWRIVGFKEIFRSILPVRVSEFYRVISPYAFRFLRFTAALRTFLVCKCDSTIKKKKLCNFQTNSDKYDIRYDRKSDSSLTKTNDAFRVFSRFSRSDGRFPESVLSTQHAATTICLNGYKGSSLQLSYRCLSEKRSNVQHSNKGRKRRRYEYDNKIRNIT